MHRLQNAGRNSRTANRLSHGLSHGPSHNLSHGPLTSAYRGRFAPSPTGDLHFGSLTAALACALQAAQSGGEWLLRIDDIDPPREEPGASESIISTLRQHGFSFLEPIVYQSQRTSHYRQALEQLTAKGLTYCCACSRQQWQSFSRPTSTSALRCPGDCSNRALDPERCAIRYKADTDESFTDAVMGRVRQNVAQEVGDFVLRRRDGLWAYQLATVVDDAVDGITEIVRGADLLDNTPRQIALARALGVTIPAYVHVPVAVDASGQKLSKQSHATPMNNALALQNLLAAWRFLGQSALPPANGVVDFWAVATELWDLQRVPTVACLNVAAASNQRGSS